MDTIKKVISGIKSWLVQPNQSELDNYIKSKNPQTSGDVDYWLGRFYRERSTKFYMY